MGILIWIIFGALVGLAASALMGGSKGAIWDILIGMAGAFIGGYIMSIFGKTGVSGFNLYSFLVALLGACVLILVVRALGR